MKVAHHIQELNDPDCRGDSSSVCALVPTMGSLHDGHLALITRARQLIGPEGTIILSLFVNPTQFDRAEDLEHYPRSLESDLELCRKYGVDIVFAPEVAEIYQPYHSVIVSESSLSRQLCGASRPGHFDGVCTVVLKLLNITRPDIALFGKKDYQQLAIIRRMVRDLNLAIRIEAVDTIRETSGLALSSRNQRLTDQQRTDAARINRALQAARTVYLEGERCVETILRIARDEIESSGMDPQIDYLEIVDQDSLQHLDTITTPAIIATAVFYGEVRLIDNIELD
ncbi:MAG: pantoate--beta-alanine ligase [Akkermansiaceae bacterium]